MLGERQNGVALALRYEEGLQAYDALCSEDRPPLRAVGERSRLLHQRGMAGTKPAGQLGIVGSLAEDLLEGASRHHLPP